MPQCGRVPRGRGCGATGPAGREGDKRGSRPQPRSLPQGAVAECSPPLPRGSGRERREWAHRGEREHASRGQEIQPKRGREALSSSRPPTGVTERRVHRHLAAAEGRYGRRGLWSALERAPPAGTMDRLRATLNRMLTPSSERPWSVSSGGSTPSTPDVLPDQVVVPKTGRGLVSVKVACPSGSLGLELETSLTGRIVAAADCVVGGVKVQRGDELTHIQHIQVADVLDFSRALTLLKLTIQQRACVLTLRRADFVPRHRSRAESGNQPAARPRSGAARESVRQPPRPREDSNSVLPCTLVRAAVFLLQAAPEVARAALVAPPARAGGGPGRRTAATRGAGDPPAVEALHALFRSQDLDLSDFLSPAQPAHVRAVSAFFASTLRYVREPCIPISRDVAQAVAQVLSRSGSPEKRRIAALCDVFAGLDARTAALLRAVGLVFHACERFSGQPHSVAAALTSRGRERPRHAAFFTLPLPDPALVRTVSPAIGAGHAEVLSVLLGVAASSHLFQTPEKRGEVHLLTHTVSFLRVWAAQQHGTPCLFQHGASRAEVEDVGAELVSTRAELARLLRSEGGEEEEGDTAATLSQGGHVLAEPGLTPQTAPTGVKSAARVPSSAGIARPGVSAGASRAENAVWTSLDRYGPRLVRCTLDTPLCGWRRRAVDGPLSPPLPPPRPVASLLVIPTPTALPGGRVSPQASRRPRRDRVPDSCLPAPATPGGRRHTGPRVPRRRHGCAAPIPDAAGSGRPIRAVRAARLSAHSAAPPRLPFRRAPVPAHNSEYPSPHGVARRGGDLRPRGPRRSRSGAHAVWRRAIWPGGASAPRLPAHP